MVAPLGERGVVDEERPLDRAFGEREAALGAQLGEAHAHARAQPFAPRVDEGNPGNREAAHIDRAAKQLLERRLGNLHRGHGSGNLADHGGVI